MVRSDPVSTDSLSHLGTPARVGSVSHPTLFRSIVYMYFIPSFCAPQLVAYQVPVSRPTLVMLVYAVVSAAARESHCPGPDYINYLAPLSASGDARSGQHIVSHGVYLDPVTVAAPRRGGRHAAAARAAELVATGAAFVSCSGGRITLLGGENRREHRFNVPPAARRLLPLSLRSRCRRLSCLSPLLALSPSLRPLPAPSPSLGSIWSLLNQSLSGNFP